MCELKRGSSFVLRVNPHGNILRGYQSTSYTSPLGSLAKLECVDFRFKTINQLCLVSTKCLSHPSLASSETCKVQARTFKLLFSWRVEGLFSREADRLLPS